MSTLLRIIILLVAIVINTSRTGLVVSFIISLIVLCKTSFKSKKNFIIGTLFTGIFLLVFALSANGIMSIRNTNNGILDDNGRFSTYKDGIEVTTSSISSFLFGNGLANSNYNFMMPHNVIIEISLKLGVIFTITLAGLCLKLIIYLRDDFLKLIIIYILLCNLLVTGFFQMSFIITIIVYMIVCNENKYIK